MHWWLRLLSYANYLSLILISSIACDNTPEKSEPEKVVVPSPGIEEKIPDFESQSQWAKSIAERFIKYLSGDVRKTVSVDKDTLQLPQAASDEIKKDATDEFNDLYNRNPVKKFDFLAQGHYSAIYAHKKYRDSVLKIMPLAKAQAEASVSVLAIKAIKNDTLYFLHAPASTVIPIPPKKTHVGDDAALFLQERLKFKLNWQGQEEGWNRLVSHYLTTQDQVFKSNFETLVDEIGLFAGKIGYWDVSGANFPLLADDAKTVFAIDFDNIDKGKSVAQDRQGFDRLVKEFFSVDPLAGIVLKQLNLQVLGVAENTAADATFADHKKRGQVAFKAKANALKEYDKRGWIFSNQPLAALDETKVANAGEKGLLKAIYGELKTHVDAIKSEDKTKALTEKRIFHVQPSSPASIRAAVTAIDGTIDHIMNRMQRNHLVTVEKMLNELKQQGIIIEWFVEWENPDFGLWQYLIYL